MVAGAFFSVSQRGGFERDQHQPWSTVTERTGHGSGGIRVWLVAVLHGRVDDLKGVI